MSILITGGAGYIGSHTCVELIQAGYDIVVIDNYANSKPESLKRVSEITGKSFKYTQVDLLNREALEEIFKNHHIKAVIHFAGLKAVGESVQKPLSYYHHNILTTLNLCELMSTYNVKKMVFSSSATVYGMQEKVPIAEDAPLLAAQNPYGRTKQMIESILQDMYQADSDWSIAMLRYFNPVGAHPSGRIGEDPSGIPNNLTPYITQVLIGKRDELLVYGDDYDTPDGTGIRDYIHVVDLAKGHIKALEKVLKETGEEAYNLGTGVGFSVFEVIRAFEQAAGRTIPYRVTERRPGDIAVSYADPVKAKRELGWVAEKGLMDMCQDAWRWQMQNPHGYKV